MRVGKKDPIGALKADTWVKDYDSTLVAAATSVTISSLTGDTAEEYILRCRFVNGVAGTTQYSLRPNNDTGNNYGAQVVYGLDTTAAAGRDTLAFMWDLANMTGSGHIINVDTYIYAKSGYIRTAMVRIARDISTTTVGLAGLCGEVWNNTANEITSLVILADQTDGLGVGTNIQLWKKVSST